MSRKDVKADWLTFGGDAITSLLHAAGLFEPLLRLFLNDPAEKQRQILANLNLSAVSGIARSDADLDSFREAVS